MSSRIDWEEEHRAKRCHETRTRCIEDIPEVQPEVTEHTIRHDWCPECKKKVEPPVPDTLGNTLSQIIVEVFSFHLRRDSTCPAVFGYSLKHR